MKRRKPNVKRLSRRANVGQLAEVASYSDLAATRDGSFVDLGVSIRESAVRALGAIPGEESSEAVARFLDDPKTRIRRAAVEVLRERGDAILIARALPGLRRSGGDAYEVAVNALRELRQDGAGPALVEALVYDEGAEPLDEREAGLVLPLLEEEGTQSELETITRLVRDLAGERQSVEERAEDLLVFLAPLSAELVRQELSERGPAAHRAASALGRMRDVWAIELLTAALDDPDPRLRAESCTALGELRDPAALEPLMRATRDPEYVVRSRAGSALDRISAVAAATHGSTMMHPSPPEQSREGTSPPENSASPHQVESLKQHHREPLPEPAGYGQAEKDDHASGTAREVGTPPRLRRLAWLRERIDDARSDSSPKEP